MIHPDYEIEMGEEACPKCESETRERECDNCDEFGYSNHECGEDCCACLEPEDNVRCDDCGGNGWHRWCPACGWDLIWNRYINEIDEREREAKAQQEAA